MPFVWKPNQVFVKVSDIKIYFVYKNDMEDAGPRRYWFGLTDTATDDGPDSFDVRDLPNWDFDINRDEDIRDIILGAIKDGIIYQDTDGVTQVKGKYHV